MARAERKSGVHRILHRHRARLIDGAGVELPGAISSFCAYQRQVGDRDITSWIVTGDSLAPGEIEPGWQAIDHACVLVGSDDPGARRRVRDRLRTIRRGACGCNGSRASIPAFVEPGADYRKSLADGVRIYRALEAGLMERYRIAHRDGTPETQLGVLADLEAASGARGLRSNRTAQEVIVRTEKTRAGAGFRKPLALAVALAAAHLRVETRIIRNRLVLRGDEIELH